MSAGRGFVLFRLAVERSCRAVMILSAVSVVLIMVFTTFEVIMRYLFHNPTSWALLTSQYLLIMCLFPAAGYILLKDGHVNVDFVLSNMSKRAQNGLNLATAIASLAFIVPVAWITARVFLQAYGELWTSSEEFLRVPLFPMYFAIALGALLFVLAALVKVYDYAAALSARKG